MISARYPLAAMLIAFLAGLIPGTAAAEHAQHEKCICDAAPSIPPGNGASVPNATACWLVEDQRREWCDVVVESLAGSPPDPTLPAVDDGDGAQTSLATDFFGGHLRWFLQTYRALGGENLMLSDLTQVEESLDRLLGRNAELLGQCLQDFRKGLMGRGFHRESSEGVACQVGEETGWLRLRLAVGGIWLTYILAPPDTL
ncbi:MAG TPA: hypothetical protein VGN97_19390 [Mesorhizobium sp.]|jgi:hypothetical protein|nr:hypothetical protein [Mesorhizobium sp.]